MSKSSTASATKNPTTLPKGAWSRGPPQQATAPSPRSQSPAPPPTPIHQTHSRRPSALGQSVSIKDGVSVPRGNIGAAKQSPAVTFGSLDGAEQPISSSPAAAPPIKSEGVKSFGTVPAATGGHVNGKASISSRSSFVPQASSLAPSVSSNSTLASKDGATVAAASPSAKPKIDIKKMFQNPSSSPSSTNTPSDTSSPALRNQSLPGQNQSSTASSTSGPSGPSASNSQSSSTHPSSQLAAHSFSTFIPRPQGGNPANGAGPPPRSPSYNRSMQNGNGPRNQGGPVGQNSNPNPGMSPRLGPPHNGIGQPGTPGGMPQGTPQMQPHMQPGMPHMGWSPYYVQGYPPDQSQYMYGWYGMPMPPQPGQHAAMPPVPSHPGMPMSPRNPPSALQNPGTPTLSHAHAVPPNPAVMPSPHMSHAHPLPHGPPHPHQHPHPPHGPNIPTPSPLTHPSTSIGGLTSPPPTPASLPSSIPPVSSTASPVTGPGRLNASSSAFVPRKVTIKTEDGIEVDWKNSTPAVPSSATPSTPYRQGSPGTPNRRPTSVRIETEEQRTARLAEQEKKEEAERRKKEEEQRKIKEAEERKKNEKEAAERKVKEAEEKKRKDKEEVERKAKAAEEKKKREEEDRRKKEEEERERKKREEEEAQKRKAEEETRRIAEEKKRKEEEEARRVAEEKKRKEEEEEKRRAEEEAKALAEAEQKAKKEKEEAEAKARAEAEVAKAKAEVEKEDGEIVEDGRDDSASMPPPSIIPSLDGKDRSKEGLRINTSTPTIDRRRPGPLDLTDAKKSNIPAPQSALATARIISDISTVQYPEGISSPRPDLNKDAKEGKFRYDREFLLQFMAICKEKPATLPPLDAIGLEPIDNSTLHMTRGGSGRHRTSSAATIPPSRQGSVGLGFSPSTLGKGAASSFNAMGNFTVGASKLSSEERFAASSRTVSASGGPTPSMQFPRPHGIVRTASQGGPGGMHQRERTRSKRGEKRNETNRVQGGQQQPFNNHYQHGQQMSFEPVVPLQASANRWDRKALQADTDSPEMVERKVKALLNKLTMEKFDSISDQIIAWANKSEKEGDGRTLIQVIKLVFEKATDEATWSEMYARLCRKMMEQISPKVQDEGIKNAEGKPIAGGQLFRKYLLNRCQEDFESGWKAKEATAKAAASKAKEDEAIKAENEKDKEDGKEEVALYSEEYYAAQKAKRQGLGLIKFIGELFKLQMLTERIMHECIKKLLGNVDNPEEEEIESLCKLLSTVGGILDTQKAKGHMDVYFSRMKELAKSQHVNSRMQFMLQDVLELRERKWHSRHDQALAMPSTIAQIHEAAAKEKAAHEKEAYQRQMSMSRGGSRRGGDRSDFPQVGPDGWAVAGTAAAPRPPPKAGDLSHFGKITKQQTMTFGPSSVFAGKKGGATAESKRESISRTASSSNMFSMLENAEKPSEHPQRKKIVLAPRSKPVESEAAETASPTAESDSSAEEDPAATAAPEMTEAQVSKKLDEDIKEFFSVKAMEEGYFTDLPVKWRSKLVENFTSAALEKKEADAKLLGQFFAHAVAKGVCPHESFSEGFSRVAEIVSDIAIDAPKALEYFAIAVKGAALPADILSTIASKSEDSDRLLQLLNSA